MKSLKYVLPFVAAALIFSCSDTPDYPEENAVEAGTVNGTKVGSDVYSTIDGTTVTVNPVDASLSSSFMRGFDASAISDSGTGEYYDASGNKKDIFVTLKSFGVNWVRLRVWNNPASSKNPSVPGASDKDVVVAQAVRAKNAGLKVLLDFHYSDYWADPGKQLIPSDWLSVTDADTMAVKISDYTKEVLNAMSAKNVLPDMIQIGNEINSGILLHSALDSNEKGTNADSSIRGTASSSDYANFVKYLAAGISAARDVAPEAKIMLHLAKGGVSLDWLLNIFKNASLDYDVLGLSYYPEESSHGTISALGTNIAHIKADYGKEVVVAETNIHYSSNSALTAATTNLKVNGSLYSGILAGSDGNVALSVQNQANVVRAIIEVTAKNGGTGVFEWGGEYKGAWNSMFASSGKPLPSLIVYNVEGK